MGVDFLIFVSKRGQRCAAAVLLIIAMHVVANLHSPEPAGPVARVDLK